MNPKTLKLTFTMHQLTSDQPFPVLSIGTKQDVTSGWKSAKPFLAKVIASLGPNLIQDNGKKN